MAIQQIPSTLVVVEISLSPKALDSMIVLHKEGLPKNWRDVDCAECLEIGSRWAENNETLILKVPSAVNPLEYNMILNPAHNLISECAILGDAPFQYDERLVQLLGVQRKIDD